jgi:Protein of unknown function (DUF2934)
MSNQQIFFGRLGIDSHGDSWLLETPGGAVLVDVTDFHLDDGALHEGYVVSIIGRMGIPTSSTKTKLIAQRLADHENVRERAFELSTRSHSGSPVDHWLQAERELLGL